MELLDSSRRTMRQSWLLAVILVVGLFVAGAPVVQAAASVVKIKDSDGDVIQSKTVKPMGEFDVSQAKGALTVRTTAGGGGLLGVGDCTADAVTSRPNVVTIDANASSYITAIIVTGTDARVKVRAPDLDALIGPFPVANFRTNATTPNAFVGLANGLTVSPSELVFTCTGWDGTSDGNGEFVILGQ